MKKVIFILIFLLPSLLSTQALAQKFFNQKQVEKCDFSQSGKWWKGDFASLPSDVANNPYTQDPEFCEFYQFSQDYFLYMISLNENNVPNFLDQSQFPLLETSGTDSCDNIHPKHAFNIRTVKSPTDKAEFVIPERIDQAGAQALYDQNGNVVFYEIRFTKNLCDYNTILKKPNFPAKTVEIKMAWKVLGAGDTKDNFYSIKADVKDSQGRTHSFNLGLVGLHMAIAADNHPEMVWVTVEQQDNTIACKNRGSGQTAKSFISKTCATGGTCHLLNETINSTKISISPDKVSDVCEEFPWGTVENQPLDTVDGLNIALLEKLDKEMQQVLTAKGVPDELNLWTNYKIKGALWVSDIKQNSGSPTGANTNQRGSLELANTVMETTFQGTYNEPNSSLNCFGCHTYEGSGNFKPDGSNWNTTLSAKQPALSHIFEDIIKGQN